MAIDTNGFANAADDAITEVTVRDIIGGCEFSGITLYPENTLNDLLDFLVERATAAGNMESAKLFKDRTKKMTFRIKREGGGASSNLASTMSELGLQCSDVVLYDNDAPVGGFSRD